jgi:hypothetical protein
MSSHYSQVNSQNATIFGQPVYGQAMVEQPVMGMPIYSPSASITNPNSYLNSSVTQTSKENNDDSFAADYPGIQNENSDITLETPEGTCDLDVTEDECIHNVEHGDTL